MPISLGGEADSVGPTLSPTLAPSSLSPFVQTSSLLPPPRSPPSLRTPTEMHSAWGRGRGQTPPGTGGRRGRERSEGEQMEARAPLTCTPLRQPSPPSTPSTTAHAHSLHSLHPPTHSPTPTHSPNTLNNPSQLHSYSSVMELLSLPSSFPLASPWQVPERQLWSGPGQTTTTT